MSDPSPSPSGRGRWVAIVTGALSILIGVLYLALILVLDSRGPLQPPPPEALGLGEPLSRPADGAANSVAGPAGVPPPAAAPRPGSG